MFLPRAELDYLKLHEIQGGNFIGRPYIYRAVDTLAFVNESKLEPENSQTYLAA